MDAYKKTLFFEKHSFLYMERRLRAYDIDAFQQPYIMFLCENGGCKQDDFSKSALVDVSNISRALARLEELGYLVRETSRDDRRIKRVYPTKKCFAMRDVILGIENDWAETVLDGIPPEERRVFLRNLSRVFANAEKLQ